MKKTFIIASAVLAALFVGCSQDSMVGRKMSDLTDRAVFLRVNGVGFCKHDFQVASSLHDKMARMRSKDPLTGPNAKAERAVLLRRNYIVSEIKRRALMGQFAAENKIVASEKNIKRAEDLFLKAMGRKRSTVEAVAAEIGGEEGELLKAWLKGDALDLTLRDHFDVEKTLDVTDADIMVISNNVKRSWETAAASNALERAVLEKALAEIKGGKDFAEVARSCSLLPEEAKDWAELDQEDVKEERTALTEWVKTAKVGDVSGILELEDGYAICKLVKYEKDDEDFDPTDVDGDPPDETWEIVRICRKFWEGYDAMSREEIVEGLLNERSRKVQKKIGDAIMAKAVVEWPCGTNLFEKVETKKSTRSVKTDGKGGKPVKQTQRRGTK